jgi:hypothetical protein
MVKAHAVESKRDGIAGSGSPSIEIQESNEYPTNLEAFLSLTISILIEKGECLLEFCDLFFGKLLCHLVVFSSAVN